MCVLEGGGGERVQLGGGEMRGVGVPDLMGLRQGTGRGGGGGGGSDAGQLMQQVGRQDGLQLLQDVAQWQVQPAQHLQHAQSTLRTSITV